MSLSTTLPFATYADHPKHVAVECAIVGRVMSAFVRKVIGVGTGSSRPSEIGIGSAEVEAKPLHEYSFKITVTLGSLNDETTTSINAAIDKIVQTIGEMRYFNFTTLEVVVGEV